jgi:hypothetical protein
MSFGQIIKKYFELIKTEEFVKYEKEFANKIQETLVKGYKNQFPEQKIVEEIVNNLNGLSMSVNRFRISTKGIFIHGPRRETETRVEFEYYGQKFQRELGDLIFILSVIYKGKKYFEKFTISQFKKDNYKLRWDFSNKEQIYLLSRFPSFRGVKGSIIPNKNFNLPNYSGCLGSFSLLFRPGDFVFVSASLLEKYLWNRKSMSINDISKFYEPLCYYFSHFLTFDWLYFDRHYIEELFECWLRFLKYRVPFPFFPIWFTGILGFSHFAPNIHDFTNKYLKGNIGELTYSYIGIYNEFAFNFLHELLSTIKTKAEKEGKTEIINFVKEFFAHSYGGNSNKGGMREEQGEYEDGGIGIIYTLINLGEGEE